MEASFHPVLYVVCLDALSMVVLLLLRLISALDCTIFFCLSWDRPPHLQLHYLVGRNEPFLDQVGARIYSADSGC